MNWMMRLSTLLGRIRRQGSRLLEQKWFDMGLRAKMGTMVTIGLFGLLSIFGFLGISNARQATRQAMSERVLLAQLSASAFDNTLSNIESTLSILAKQPAFQSPDAPPSARLAALHGSVIYQHQVHFIQLDGFVLNSAAGQDNLLNWFWIPAVQNALQGESYNLSLINDASLGGNPPWVVIAVPAYTETGKVNGVLAVLIDLIDTVNLSIQHASDLGQTGTLDVTDETGLVLFSTDPSRMMKTNVNPEVMRRLFIDTESGAENCLGCSEDPSTQLTDEVIAFAPLSKAPWGVIIRQLSSEVFAHVNRLIWQTLLLGLIAIGGAMILVWLTTNSVINPVQLLMDAAQRIAQGDLETPVPIPPNHRRDEIGALTISFSRMRHRLQESMTEIQVWNQELDQRVTRRTQEARAAQEEAQRARDDLRSVIDALSDQLVVIDVATSSILQVNQAAQELYPDESLINQPCCTLFHPHQPCQPPNCTCPRPQVIELGKSVKVTHIHSDQRGQTRYLDIIASPLRDTHGNISRIVELSRDVTEERRIRESLERRNEQLIILNKVAATVNSSLDLDEILGRALKDTLHLTGIDVGAIFLLQDSLGTMDMIAYQGLSEESAQLASRLGMLDSACGGVLDRGQIIVVPDLSRMRGHRARSLQREKLSTLVHVPLIVKGSKLGSMCVATHKKREFGEEDQALLTAIGSQIAVAIENARLYAEVQQKERLRGELFKKAINAQEDERKRIARELHDETSQSLAAILFALEEGFQMEDLVEVRQHLENISQLTRHTLDGIHKVIFDLRPTMLDHLGMVPALRWLAESRLEPLGIRVEITEERSVPRLTSQMETALYRVVQEAIGNIARHAAARRVKIHFEVINQSVEVHIEDDGIGFDLTRLVVVPESNRGLGLLGMEERLELLGGELEIITHPGHGTKLNIIVPLERVPSEVAASLQSDKQSQASGDNGDGAKRKEGIPR